MSIYKYIYVATGVHCSFFSKISSHDSCQVSFKAMGLLERDLKEKQLFPGKPKTDRGLKFQDVDPCSSDESELDDVVAKFGYSLD